MLHRVCTEKVTYRPLSDLQNKHAGEDVWAVLSGASLDFIDPLFFANKVVVGVNSVFKKFDCSYVVMKDCMESPRFTRSVQECNDKGIPLVFSEHHRGKPGFGPNEPLHDQGYIFSHNARCQELAAELDGLQEHQLVVSKSTVTTLMHFCAYLGAHSIILCGHDCATIDGKMFYDGYLEPDWPHQHNDSHSSDWWASLEAESTLVKKFLASRYGCHIHSLNPFLNLGYEGKQVQIFKGTS